MKFPRKRTLLYIFLGFLLLTVVGVWGGIKVVTAQFFAEHPNRLSVVGDLHSVPFRWARSTYDDYVEPHAAILLPVSVPGIEEPLFMQFDTGSPSTFFRSGCLDSLAERGIEFELYDDDGTARVKHFELNVGQNRVVLEGGWVMGRDISIDWEKPINIIGSIGADFVDQQICAFDFPGQTFHLLEEDANELDALGEFQPFRFPGRRIMLPAEIDGTELELFYDSGCSSFGLITSKYHFDRFADQDAEPLSLGIGRFGDSIPVHHQPCLLDVRFGETELPLKRVSYVDSYSGLQSAFGRFVNGGFMGNKFLLDSTLILNVKSKEFLVVPYSLGGVEQPDADLEN